jgi:hypothetical protein
MTTGPHSSCVLRTKVQILTQKAAAGFNAESGSNKLGLRKCYTQFSAGNATLLLVDDKREDAEEICAEVLPHSS